jgi:hypothetical protein
MKINRTLAIVAVVLFVLSVWSYRSSAVRAGRFERGQPFLPNLNPDEIAEIMITKGSETVTLKRGDDRFIIAEAHGYPAKNEAVNRLIRSALDLSLEKEVGRGEGLHQELELIPGGESTAEVVFKNAADMEMVHFLVGKELEGGTGSYLRRVDEGGGAVFLSSGRAHLNTAVANYLDKDLVDVKRDDIARITGGDFEVMDSDDGLKLSKVPSGREEKPSEMNRIKGVLSYLRFDEVFVADDPEVSDLSFDTRLEVELKDGSGYRLALASKGDADYLRIAGYHTIERVAVGRDESDEDLQDKAEILSRADEMAKFSTFHASWVYKVSKPTADKIRLSKSDLIQKKS